MRNAVRLFGRTSKNIGYTPLHWVYAHGKAEEVVQQMQEDMAPDDQEAADLLVINEDHDIPLDYAGVINCTLCGVHAKLYVWPEYFDNRVIKRRDELPPQQGEIVGARLLGGTNSIEYTIRAPLRRRGLVCLWDDKESCAYAQGRLDERSLIL